MDYYKDGNFVLQVWNHGNEVDSVEMNLLSNFYSEYNTEDTLLVEKKE